MVWLVYCHIPVQCLTSNRYYERLHHYLINTHLNECIKGMYECVWENEVPPPLHVMKAYCAGRQESGFWFWLGLVSTGTPMLTNSSISEPYFLVFKATLQGCKNLQRRVFQGVQSVFAQRNLIPPYPLNTHHQWFMSSLPEEN